MKMTTSLLGSILAISVAGFACDGSARGKVLEAETSVVLARDAGNNALAQTMAEESIEEIQRLAMVLWTEDDVAYLSVSDDVKNLVGRFERLRSFSVTADRVVMSDLWQTFNQDAEFLANILVSTLDAVERMPNRASM